MCTICWGYQELVQNWATATHQPIWHATLLNGPINKVSDSSITPSYLPDNSMDTQFIWVTLEAKLVENKTILMFWENNPEIVVTW